MKRQGENIQKQSVATKSSTDFDCKHIKDCYIREFHGCGDYHEDKGYTAEDGCTTHQQYVAMLVERAKLAIESVMRGEGIPQEEMRREAKRRIEATRQRRLLEQAALLELSKTVS